MKNIWYIISFLMFVISILCLGIYYLSGGSHRSRLRVIDGTTLKDMIIYNMICGSNWGWKIMLYLHLDNHTPMKHNAIILFIKMWDLKKKKIIIIKDWYPNAILDMDNCLEKYYNM